MFRLALVALALSSGYARAADACLPFTPGDGGSPMIEARVNGQGPFTFVLDTAASGTTLDEAAIERLKLARDTATEAAQGLGGPMDVHLYRVASIEAGAVGLRDTVVPEIPAPEFESHAVTGLAGVDLLGERLTVWRPQDRCVDLSPSGGRPAGDGWSVVEAVWLRPWKIMLPVRIAGRDGLALLDTGAQYSVLNSRFAEQLGLTEASGRLRAGGEIQGIDGRPLPLLQGDVAEASIGTWRWSNAAVRVAEMPVFARLGEPDAPLMILGMDWLAGRGFAVDYGAQKVWLRSDRN
jgi:predicted aspartyl protease